MDVTQNNPESIDIEEKLGLADRIEKRNRLLKDVPPDVVKRAWFTLSHLLLGDGAKIVDMGCGEGTMTYAMAALNPKLHFIGVDQNKRLITRAREQFHLPNLEYISNDISLLFNEEESLDAIINSYTLHEIYSAHRYNERVVSQILETHFKMLKKGGIMFIHDYSRPPREEFVLIELPDTPSKGDKPSELSDADLLIWYSEHARPKQDPGCGGFFLEELPSRFPKTRLFHLPHKWAYEFVMRKDDREDWEKILPIEYTFFTPQDFRKELSILGARVQYSGPHWDEDFINTKFEGKFRLFEPNGALLGNPPTSFVAVAHKLAERKSLLIEERRPSAPPASSPIRISAMRDSETGEIVDIVSRDVIISEIIPYRINTEGHLKIYLHDGITRSVVNAVPRQGMNFDGRRWSGHMIEPISVDQTAISMIEEFNPKYSALFARDYLGLKPKDNAVIMQGPDFYPSPEYIDDRIFTYYLQVEKAVKAVTPKSHGAYNHKYQAKGEIREFDAQQVLNAISVGMIPNARLEIQILMLFERLEIKAENWTTKEITFRTGQIKQKTSLKSILDKYGAHKEPYKEVRGSAGQVRPVHSIFVEQGQSKGTMTGLTSQDVDFIVREDQTINTAVVLPLTKGLKNDVHAGFFMKHLPIPQRHEGNANTIAAPSFNLPPEITNEKMVKKFIAEQFEVLPAMVVKLGESYFSHIGLTPQRIHPYAVIVPPDKPGNPKTNFLPFYQMKLLRRSLSKDVNMMIVLARAYKFLSADIKIDFDLRVKAIVKERFANVQKDWALPVNFTPAPLPQKRSRDISTEQDFQPTLHLDLDQEKTSQAPNYAAEELTPEDLKEFDQQLDEVLESILQPIPLEPKPEKW